MSRGTAPCQDRRASERTPVCWPARIRSANVDFDCVITNISTQGARVLLQSAMGFGDSVLLDIPGHGALYGSTVWHSQRELGVIFCDDAGKIARVISGAHLGKSGA